MLKNLCYPTKQTIDTIYGVKMILASPHNPAAAG
jgi:hypothetical protein